MDDKMKKGQIFADEGIEEEERPPTKMERYKNKIVDVFQKATIISHTILMVLFFIVVYGVVGDVEGKSAFAFAFALIIISLMSVVIYSPKIIDAIARFIMWVMKKLNKQEEKYIKLFCIFFSLLPILLYVAFVLALSLVYLVI